MQHDIKNLLYATDLSQNSLYAFSYAAYLARLTGADIHLLHVLEPLSEDATFAVQVYIQDDTKRHDMLELRVERARKALEDRQEKFWAAQTGDDRKIRAQIKSVTVCESFPAEEILKSAKEHNCDLIVMGSHERGMLHTFLGSVAKSVLRRAQVPTLVVPLGALD
ncbi:MAG: universal stress protein [Alphaproteobacteria bacterium]|nr:universal stress protein [Alphaproteobacteria bacterium]